MTKKLRHTIFGMAALIGIIGLIGFQLPGCSSDEPSASHPSSTGFRAESAPMFCNITSALKAPCCTF